MTPGELERTLTQLKIKSRLSGGLLAITLISVIAGGSGPILTQAATDNPIVLENQQPGSNGWMWSSLANDTSQQIKGYASAASVKQNESLTFYVTVNPAQSYTIDVYRMGWYGGLGGRLRLHAGPLDGVQQPPCPMDSSTGMIACSWAPAYTLTVPSDWTSGVYVALLTNAQGFQNYVKFVVRDGRPAAFLYQQPVNTEHAYNDFPNDGQSGKSLYNYNSYGANTMAGEPRAVKVSFDRPFADSGNGLFFNWEIQLLRWLERSGYDVTYSTDVDTHANGGELRNHKAFLSAPHDEYWSKEMFDAAEAARDAGVNLAFFGANSVYTQVRFEPSAAGVPNRAIVCYRYPFLDPVSSGPTTTTEFRKPPVNRPEQTLVGVQYSDTLLNTDYLVTNSSHWAYAGTGFRDGDAARGIVGYEADVYMANYPPPNSTNQTLLSRSPISTDSTGATVYSSASIYQAPSRAWVFASGTMSWSWALDDVPGPLGTGRVDARIQRTTANILNAFLYGAPPTITNFTPAIGPVGTNVTISGANFTGTTAVRFNGTAASFTVISDTAIQATVPAGAKTGPVSVTTPGGTATSAINFTVTVQLTVSKANSLGIGSGTVTSSPAGIDCGATCSHFFSLDSVVNLDVSTSLPSVFNGWSGCDAVSGTTCTVAMSRARAVTANFLP